MLLTMRKIFIALLGLYSAASSLWAVPAQVENNDYKVTLSETLPGIDGPGFLPSPNAGITVTVTDKFRSQQVSYPLKAYAIASYFLSGDDLNLVARTTLINNPNGPRYDFIQLNLSSPSDSHQLQNLEQYYFSPDQQNLLLVADKSPDTPWVGIAQLAQNPLALQWLYAESAGINLFKTAFAAPVSALTLSSPVGWAADSLSGAFLFSVDDGSRDPQGKPLLKDYLAELEQTNAEWKVTVQPVDLSAYHFHTGAALTDLRCDGRKISLFLTSDTSTNPVEVDFKLNPP